MRRSDLALGIAFVAALSSSRNRAGALHHVVAFRRSPRGLGRVLVGVMTGVGPQSRLRTRRLMTEARIWSISLAPSRGLHMPLCFMRLVTMSLHADSSTPLPMADQGAKILLSHVDRHLTLGGLVARLVRDGLDRYDPAHPPRAGRSGGRNSVGRERSSSTPARRGTEAVQRSAARAKGSTIERRSEVVDDASLAAAWKGVPGPSVPKRVTQDEGVPTEVAESMRVTEGDARQRRLV